MPNSGAMSDVCLEPLFVLNTRFYDRITLASAARTNSIEFHPHQQLVHIYLSCQPAHVCITMSFNGPLSNPVVEPTASSTAHHCVSLSTFVKRMVDTLTRDFDSSTIYRVDFSNMVSLIRVTRKRRLAANNGLMKWLGSNPDFLVGAVGLGRITDRGPPLVHKYTSHMLCYDSSEAMENAIKCMQQRPQIVTRRIQFTIHVKKGLQVKYATTKTAFKTKLQPLQFGERLGLQQASIHCCVSPDPRLSLHS